MLAVSRTLNRAYLYQPATGTQVPLTVDLTNGRWEVAMPSIRQLEEEYEVFETVEDAAEFLGGKAELIARARKQSDRHAKPFRKDFAKGLLTVGELRERVANSCELVAAEAAKRKTKEQLQSCTKGTRVARQPRAFKELSEGRAGARRTKSGAVASEG